VGVGFLSDGAVGMLSKDKLKVVPRRLLLAKPSSEKGEFGREKTLIRHFFI
jgi:hypothetical protein